jgi:hypothetical protein
MRVIADTGRYVPLALCGRNERLRGRLASAGRGVTLGWRDDIPHMLAGCDAVIENAGGLTCLEALAAGVPVVTFQPIPGHGRDCARAFERAGLTLYPAGPAGLLTALDAVTARSKGAMRHRLLAAGEHLFTAPAVPSGAAPPTSLGAGFPHVINRESPCEQISKAHTAGRGVQPYEHPSQEVAR